jgi:hypothetical protein
MSKINILNLVLSIIVISLALSIYFSEEESFELDRLTNIDTSHVTKIEINHNKNKTTIIKQDNDWSITQPVFIAANSFRLNSVLKLLNAPIHKKYPLSEINTSSFGLANPTTTIQFDDMIIRFGITNPATNLRYIQLNDSVYTIEDVYYPLISSHFSTLVSLNLLPGNSTIEKLVLLDQTISKDDNGLWKSTVEIDGDSIIKIIGNWQHMQAFGIHEFLPRKELGGLLIYLKGKQEPVTFLLSETDPWLILARPELGIEYHLNVEAYDDIIEPRPTTPDRNE